VSVPLYSVTVLIWGTTWLAITYQLGPVHPAASIAYRFVLAAPLMLAWARVRRSPLRYPPAVHARLAAMGLFMFCGNFMCFYVAEETVPSGFVAIVFAMSLWPNILLSWLAFGRRPRADVLVGGAVGLGGLVLTLWSSVAGQLGSVGARGLLLSAGGTLLFCLGNLVSGKVQAAGVPVLPGTGWAMAYGAVASTVVAVTVGGGLSFEASASYVVALVYLAVFGSVVGFGAYLTLLGAVGAERAAYATVLFPIVALAVSTVVEDVSWTWPMAVGVAFALLGNAFVLGGATGRQGRAAPRRSAPTTVPPGPAER